MSDFRLGLLEQKLISYFATGGTAYGAEEEFGVPAAQAYQMVKDALSRADVWTVIELNKMNVVTLQDLLRKARDGYDSTDARSTEAIAKLVQAIHRLQREQFEISDEDVERIAVAHAVRMREIVETGYSKARAFLVEQYPDVAVELIDQVFQAGLLEAAREADKE